MIDVSLLLYMVAAVAVVATVGVTLLARFITKRARLSIVLGGLALPAFTLLGLLYWLLTLEVDDPPPGIVIVGNLLIIGVISFITLLTSYLTVRLLSRSETENGL